MFVILIVVILILLYFYGTKNHDYWKKKGVKYEKPLIFLGSSLKPMFDKKSLSECYGDVYWKYPDEKFVGTYEMRTPMLVVRDPEIIKLVFVNDFKHFHYRGLVTEEHGYETLMQNIFHSDGDTWKLLRQKMTSVFSSGKLKAMFPLIIQRTEKLLNLADTYAINGKEVDIRELMARFTTDFIGACGFGLDTDVLNDEDSEFRKMGKRIFTITTRDSIVRILKEGFPMFTKSLNFFAPEIEKSVLSLVKQILIQRNYKPSGRNDFIDMMLELQQKGQITGESIVKSNPDGTPAIVHLDPTDDLIAAQVFVFFAAGFETSSSASSFLLHMLAFHPEEQVRCQQEIDEVLNNHGGQLCYDAVRDMKYLEMALKESLRIFPPLGFHIRQCVKKYTFPGTNLTIDEGINVLIPLEAIQNDEKYFENPKEFRPSRFHPDNIGKINKFTYMPFGEGPRNCIGERLGMMQSLAGVAAVLSKFTLAPSENSILVPRVNPSALLIQTIQGGLPLTLKRRTN